MEYKIVWNVDFDKLTADVNAHIQEGWRPKGGVTVSTYLASPDDYDPTIWCAQAMVRDEDDEDDE